MSKELKKTNTKDISKDKVEKEMSFLDHLEELRWHLVRSALSVVVFAIVVFSLKEYIFDYIIFSPKNDVFPTYKIFCGIHERLCFSPPAFEIIPREFGEKFFTHLKVSIWLGIIISFPYIIWELWRFIKPGLYPNEKKAARGMVFICSLLFMMGIAFGYFIIAPFAISFLAGYTLSSTEVIASSSLSSYVNSLTMFTFPTGIVFELPVIVYFLSRIGIVSPAFMKKYRRHAIIIILLIAAVFTPPEVVTQVLIAIPVFVLYEVSIHVSKRAYKKYQSSSEN